MLPYRLFFPFVTQEERQQRVSTQDSVGGFAGIVSGKWIGDQEPDSDCYAVIFLSVLLEMCSELLWVSVKDVTESPGHHGPVDQD